MLYCDDLLCCDGLAPTPHYLGGGSVMAETGKVRVGVPRQTHRECGWLTARPFALTLRWENMVSTPVSEQQWQKDDAHPDFMDVAKEE